MRAKLFYLSAALMVSTSIHAQIFQDDTHTFYGALTAGATFSQVDGDNYAGYSKTGFAVGGAVYMRVIDNMAVSMEILYSQKGARSKESLISSDQRFLINRYLLNLNYAEVPIQLWYFDKHNHHFGGGFSYSQLINSDEKTETDPPQPVQQDITAGKYPFKKSDINIVLTANFRIWKGLYTGLRFNYSLAPIRTGQNVPPGFGRNEQFNNVVSVRFTYLFMQRSSYYEYGGGD